jgi:hypothetical protein
MQIGAETVRGIVDGVGDVAGPERVLVHQRVVADAAVAVVVVVVAAAAAAAVGYNAVVGNDVDDYVVAVDDD